MVQFTVRQFGAAKPLDLGGFRRLVCWFSCGCPSTVAARIALRHAKASGIETVVAYCDTKSEHEDNARFLRDAERFMAHPVTVLSNTKYADVWDVWERERYIAGVNGAPCTTRMKKQIADAFRRDGDLEVYGYDASEARRVELFAANQPEVALWCPVFDLNTHKDLCKLLVQAEGIQLPAMYRLGFDNNNCPGCPKGGVKYWCRIREKLPHVFWRMAALSRKLGVKLVKLTINGVRVRVYLDEIPLDYDTSNERESAMSCGIVCQQPET